MPLDGASLYVRLYFCSNKDPDILPRIIGNLTMMLQDDSVQVAKKVILCMGQIYKIAFEVISHQYGLSLIHAVPICMGLSANVVLFWHTIQGPGDVILVTCCSGSQSARA